MRIFPRGHHGARAALAPFLLLSLVLASAAPAFAGTWKIGVNPNDCGGPCNWYCGHPQVVICGAQIATAMGSPSVMPGDTVKVWPGTYTQQFTMKSDVTLLSAQGPLVTRLDGQSGTTPMCTWTATGASTTIDGFTIRWSSQAFGTGGGIAAYVASGTIRNNIFRDCLAALGSALYLQFCDLTVENNVFLNNQCEAGGGTVAVAGGWPIIRGNTFYGSTAPPGFQGAALYASGSDLVFERNLISHSLGGSAVHCAGTNNADINCNLVWDSELGSFGGTCVDSSGASGNLTADPYLCNPVAEDFGVCADSPAVTGPCGRIGYTSPDCPACVPTAAAEPLQVLSWGRVKSSYRR